MMDTSYSYASPQGSMRAAQAQAAQPTVMKIAAFRDFATSLAMQMVEQLCQEYEREVNVMYGDVVQYRAELSRVAELLQSQIQREKQLHEMMETILGHQELLANSARGHGVHADSLKDPMLATEEELQRIVQILQTPIIPEVAPAPVRALAPSTVPGGGAGGGAGGGCMVMQPQQAALCGSTGANSGACTPRTNIRSQPVMSSPVGSATQVRAAPLQSASYPMVQQGGTRTGLLSAERIGN